MEVPGDAGYNSDDHEKTQWCPQHGRPLPCDKCGMKDFVEVDKDKLYEYLQNREIHDSLQDLKIKALEGRVGALAEAMKAVSGIQDTDNTKPEPKWTR